MNIELIETIKILNPWLENNTVFPLSTITYTPRLNTDKLFLPEWDKIWLILVGPRQAGKTTLGKYIAQTLVQQKRFEQLIYLNCDFMAIRQFIRSPLFIQDLMQEFDLKNPIIFIDEAQRLENPGLLLKGIADLALPIKMIASGSSQLEIKSTIQEYLTGRHLEVQVFPFSYEELGGLKEEYLIYGLFPGVVLSSQKAIVLQQLYNDYINKDIIEILQVSKPDTLQKLITLIAHSAGQLVNYNQLATDCRVSIPTIQHYCGILESTYVISCLKPYVGNKRKELVSNPIYYFIDNGFRNQALRQFSNLNSRSDTGLLVENAVFQELIKYRAQHFASFNIHYWRTQSGAEVDFVVYYNTENLIPIEAKYRNMQRPMVSRSMRSFITGYFPKKAIIITHNYKDKINLDGCMIHFVPLEQISQAFSSLLSNFIV